MNKTFKNYLILSTLLMSMSLPASPIAKNPGQEIPNIIIRGDKTASVKRTGIVLTTAIISALVSFFGALCASDKNEDWKTFKTTKNHIIWAIFPALVSAIIAHKVSTNKKCSRPIKYRSIIAAAGVGAITNPKAIAAWAKNNDMAIATSFAIGSVVLPGIAAYLYSDGFDKSKVTNRIAEAEKLIAELNKSADTTQLNYLHDLMAALTAHNKINPFNKTQLKSFNQSRDAYATLIQSSCTKVPADRSTDA